MYVLRSLPGSGPAATGWRVSVTGGPSRERGIAALLLGLDRRTNHHPRSRQVVTAARTVTPDHDLIVRPDDGR
jgi:hypothetical protein